MSPVVKNILAVVIGIIFGMIVNMGIVMISGVIVPPPAGADLTTAEGINAALPMMQPIHFLMPFLAHALGAFFGAFIAVKIAVSHHMNIAIGIGCFNLLGGIAAAYMIPAPTWFIATDLILAYLPMAYLGGILGKPKTNMTL